MTREEAIAWFKNSPFYNENHEPYIMAISALQVEYEDYEHATLVDIKEPLKVSVVRCKDCRHYGSDGGALMVCDVSDMVVDDADYCSYGERIEP